MFVVCDSMWKLSEAFYSRYNFVDTIRIFSNRFKGDRTLLIYRDIRNSGNPGDLVFYSMLSPRQVKKLLSS